MEYHECWVAIGKVIFPHPSGQFPLIAFTVSNSLFRSVLYLLLQACNQDFSEMVLLSTVPLLRIIPWSKWSKLYYLKPHCVGVEYISWYHGSLGFYWYIHPQPSGFRCICQQNLSQPWYNYYIYSVVLYIGIMKVWNSCPKISGILKPAWYLSCDI